MLLAFPLKIPNPNLQKSQIPDPKKPIGTLVYLDVAVIKSNLIFFFVLTGEKRPPRAKERKREAEMVPA